jgi:Antitoxin VbhA
MTAESITPDERTEREHRVAEAIHSGEMEGLHVTSETRADADEYVAGRIDSDELVERARARYGLS